jgi:hypothetical protein
MAASGFLDSFTTANEYEMSGPSLAGTSQATLTALEMAASVL